MKSISSLKRVSITIPFIALVVNVLCPPLLIRILSKRLLSCHFIRTLARDQLCKLVLIPSTLKTLLSTQKILKLTLSIIPKTSVNQSFHLVWLTMHSRLTIRTKLHLSCMIEILITCKVHKTNNMCQDIRNKLRALKRLSFKSVLKRIDSGKT